MCFVQCGEVPSTKDEEFDPTCTQEKVQKTEGLDVFLAMFCWQSQGSLSILGKGLGFNQSGELLRADCTCYTWMAENESSFTADAQLKKNLHHVALSQSFGLLSPDLNLI